jgi:hypothetical protein
LKMANKKNNEYKVLIGLAILLLLFLVFKSGACSYLSIAGGGNGGGGNPGGNYPPPPAAPPMNPTPAITTPSPTPYNGWTPSPTPYGWTPTPYPSPEGTSHDCCLGCWCDTNTINPCAGYTPCYADTEPCTLGTIPGVCCGNTALSPTPPPTPSPEPYTCMYADPFHACTGGTCPVGQSCGLIWEGAVCYCGCSYP